MELFIFTTIWIAATTTVIYLEVKDHFKKK